MFTNSTTNRVLNKYATWKYIILILVIAIGFIYAIPNLYPEVPAIQIAANSSTVKIDDALVDKVKQTLTTAAIPFVSAKIEHQDLVARFQTSDEQLHAQSKLKAMLGDKYTVALNLAPTTPSGLAALGATPMKLGLDLQGGVHLLLDVDVKSVLSHRLEADIKTVTEELRTENIRYAGVAKLGDQRFQLTFRDQKNLNDGYDLLQRHYPQFMIVKNNEPTKFQITATMTQQALQQAQDYVIDQTMTTLRNRVNELGISEAAVQRQGADRVSVDLPGVLDAGRAKQILGGTATLEFHLVDETHDANNLAGQIPIGSRLFTYRDAPVLLQKQIVLQGSSITNAISSICEDGRPCVNITLGGGGESMFNRITRENIGKGMAIVYVETKTDTQMVNGAEVKTHRKQERVINVAVIQSALGSSFQITGLEDQREAANLALFLRAGALPANIDIAQERTVGPSLGKENIRKGILSVEIGLLLVMIFMATYYRLFGLIADVALLMNLVLLVALLSILGMVLTLPGIAGIVLTVGMAVDANVLIFERIREELRNGITPQAAIHAGYERAFATIVDANVTTLIAALALFAIGTGPIKGFAVTLSVGILTSMLTAISGTRALVNMIYGGRVIKKLSIGI